MSNIRIEFFGGPSDGEVLFQRETPGEHYELVSRNDGDVITHMYDLRWEADGYVKYFYSGCK